MTKRAYKERFYPTSEQAELLAQSFGCARFVWNNTLAYRTEAYQQRGESVSHSSAEKRLVGLKAEFPWLRDVSSAIVLDATSSVACVISCQKRFRSRAKRSALTSA